VAEGLGGWSAPPDLCKRLSVSAQAALALSLDKTRAIGSQAAGNGPSWFDCCHLG